MEQREERLSLLRLSRVATEEDEVKEEDEVSCLDFAERQKRSMTCNVRAEYPFRKTKTSDFFDENIRTFEAKHPYFCPKKSDVLHFPDRCIAFFLPPSTKKVFEILLHFLHHGTRYPVFTDYFG